MKNCQIQRKMTSACLFLFYFWMLFVIFGLFIRIHRELVWWLFLSSEIPLFNNSNKIMQVRTFVIVLVVAMVRGSNAGQDFTSYQASVYEPGIITKDNSPYSASLPLPSGLDPSTTTSGIVLSGYSFISTNENYFNAVLQPIVSTNITITITVDLTFKITIIKFYLIFAKTNSDWVWIISGFRGMVDVKPYSNGIYNQLFFLNGVPSVIPVDTSTIKSFIMLTGFSGKSIFGAAVEIILVVSNLAFPNQVQIRVSRTSDNTKISWAGFVVVLVNQATILERNIPYYTNYVSLFTSPSTFGPEYFLQNTPLNFDIPRMFRNPLLGGFQGNCMLAVFMMKLGGNIATERTRTAIFSSLTFPISDQLTQVPDLLYGGSIMYFEDFELLYNILCVTTCPPGQAFNQSQSLCIDCPFQCEECYTIYNCTTCIGTFTLNVTSGQCVPCSSVIDGCLDCTNGSYCLSCNDQRHGFDLTSQKCVGCYLLFPGCQSCTNQACTSCLMGYLIESRCTSIPGCASSVVLVTGQQLCMACDSSLFNPSPVDGRCQCLNQGTVVNGICNNIPGCIFPILDASLAVTCRFCNISANMKGTPDSNGLCLCKDKYQEDSTGVCRDICGDGYLMQTSSSSCDDGNSDNGDGCSSQCQVETYYKCENGSSTTPSVCVYRGIPLSLNLSQIERTEGMNQGVFLFDVSPPLININRMDLRQCVELECELTAYAVSKIAYSSGTLEIIADYTEDMEGRACLLTFSYNASVIISPNSTLSFEAVSRNAPLIVSHKLDFFAQFRVIFRSLSYVALGVFVASLSHKLIGAQLLTCCQMVYLSHSFYSTPSFLLTSIKSFNPVTGLWTLFYEDSDQDLLFPFTDRVQLTAFFVKSSLVVVGTLLASVLIWLPFMIYSQTTSKEQSFSLDQRGDALSLPEKAVRGIYKVLMFPITAGFFIVLSVSAYVSCRRLSQSSSAFLCNLNSLSLLFAISMMGAITYIECSSSYTHRHLKGESNVKNWYVPLFLLRSFAIALLIEAGIPLSLSKTLYAAIAIEVVYLVLILIKRPYESILHGVGVIFCEVTTLYSLFLALIRHFFVPQEQIEVLLIFALEGLIILAVFISLLRVAKVIWSSIKEKCRGEVPLEKESSVLKQRKTKRQVKSKESEQQRQLIDKFRQQRSNPNKSNKDKLISDVPSDSPLGCLSRAEDQVSEGFELTKIKQKLRQNLFSHKKRQKKSAIQ